MAIKISELPAADTPLEGDETFAIVQDGETKKATINETAWGLAGNSGTDSNVSFIGTTDGAVLVIQRHATYPDGLISIKPSLCRIFIGDAGGVLNGTSIKVDDSQQEIELNSTNLTITAGNTFGAGRVLVSDANGLASWETLAAGNYSGIPAYANNAAAVAAIGAGKLYYTDTAGEYILKLSH